jgi:hypothetical protein
VDKQYYVAFRVGKRGMYELKKPLQDLFRIVPEQEEDLQPASKSAIKNPDEIIDD